MFRFSLPRLQLLVAMTALLAACADDAPLAPRPQASVASTVTITGTVTDFHTGASICVAMPDPVSSAYVQVWKLEGTTWTFLAQGYIGCDNGAQFSIDVPAGDNYYLLGEFYSGHHEPYPNRWIDRRPFHARSSRVRDARIAQGRELRGGAYLNRAPLPGAEVALVVEDGEAPKEIYPWWYGGYFQAGADGLWSWWQINEPTLQRGLKYTATCGDQLGTKLLTPPTTFTFPSELRTLRCDYARAPFTRTSHLATRMAVTMFPGMFGTNHDDKTDGLGWGAQFKDSDGEEPSHDDLASLARDVRFAFTVNDNIVLTGSGAMVGLISHSNFISTGAPRSAISGAGRRISYELSDPVSGLDLTQISYDGNGGDHVMIQLRLKNTTASPMVIHGGIAADWGIVGGGSMDGQSALGGRLGWASNWANAKYIGTAVFGTEHTPRVYVDTWGIRDVNVQADGVKALQGFYTNTAANDTFFLMFHTIGPLTIPAGGQRNVWLALVGGMTQVELEANTAAAGADYTARTGRASGL